MPSQGALPEGSDDDLGLIETFKWSREEGYAFLAEHMARLEHSAGVLGFAFRRDAVVQQLDEFAHSFDETPQRVRYVLFRAKPPELTAMPLGGPTTGYRVVIAPHRHESNDAWLRHKTTMRGRYEAPLAQAVATTKADEILFLNERDELCEGARTNLFVRRDGRLLTPPLACGLLPGALRAHLIATGQAHEAVLHLADLAPGAEWFLGNSVRGLVRAMLIEG